MIFQTNLPGLKMTNDEYVLDLKFRSEIRNTYPGACAIEFLSHLEILINKLIG